MRYAFCVLIIIFLRVSRRNIFAHVDSNKETCGPTVDTGEWFRHEQTDTCFFLSNYQTSWDDAEKACNQLNAHLASIQADQHDFIKEKISSSTPLGTSYWIGLRLKNPATLTHIWIDGNLSNIFRNWNPGEPHPQGVQGCVLIANDNGGFWDEFCWREWKYRFMCRAMKEPVIVPTEFPPAAYNDKGCPGSCQGCVRFRDYCYYFSSPNDIKSWVDASLACAAIYEHPSDPTKSSYLASIHDQLEQDFVLGHMGEVRLNRWIGLFEDDWDKRSLFYVDNTRFDYSNWNWREPLPSDHQALCVLMYGDAPKAGRWNDEECHNLAGYVCKVKKDPSIILSNTQDAECLPGFTHMTGACFAVLPVPPNQSARPDAVCSNHPGVTVAAVTNIRENAFIHTLLAQASDFSNEARTVFLGGKIQNGQLKWDNGCFPKYVNIPNFYSQTTLPDSCLVMGSDGTWSTTTCGQKVDFVVCEKRSFDCERVEIVNTGYCPPGFPDECHDYCYRASFHTSDIATEDPLKTWADAKTDCASRGSSLVSIRSEQDQRCIEKHLEKSTTDVWIGLYEESYDPISRQGVWKWMDQNLEYSGNYLNWAAGEPNMHGSDGLDREGCVEMWIGTNMGQWNNMACYKNDKRGYICEKAKIPVPVATNTTCGASDGGNWYYYTPTDTCFFISSSSTSWDLAEQECNAKNAHLASIEAGEHEYIKNLLSGFVSEPTSFWIGLRLQNPVTMTHYWVDGNLANLFRPWDVNEPHALGVQGCVLIKSDTGKFIDEYCLREWGYRFLCRKKKDPIVLPTSLPLSAYENKGCPINCTNCVRFRDSCYYFSPPNVAANWSEANSACQQIYQNSTDPSSSSNLVSIHDQLEQNFVLAHMGTSGVNRWIGLFEDDWDQVTFFYTDHTPFNYNNWNWHEPLPTTTGALCVMIYGSMAKAGRWNDEYCNLKIGYVCKMKKDVSVIVSEETDPLCKPGFTYLEGACFAVVAMSNRVMSDNDAQDTCASIGGRKASIVNIHENAFIHTIFAQKSNFQTDGDPRAWLGAKIRNNQLKWDAGCFAKFNNIPNFYTGNFSDGSCVTIDNTGKWLVQPCSDNNQYVICEHRTIECIKADVNAPGLCPSGFADECNDLCLRVSFHTPDTSTANQLKTFEDANTECRAWNASLVSIRNERDQQCIEKHTEKSAGNLWIGLYESFDPVNKGVWKWIDPSVEYTGGYTNWQPGQPDNLGPGPSSEGCTEFIGGDNDGWKHGKWNNIACNAGVKGYICEKPKVNVDNCGQGQAGNWYHDDKTDSRFFISCGQADWNKAEQTCMNMNAHLATIDVNQHDFILSIIETIAPIETSFWIGLRLSNAVTMTHTWVDGNFSNLYRPWDVDEPHFLGIQGCTLISNSNGKFRDEYCLRSWGYRYICREKKEPLVLPTTLPPEAWEDKGCPAACIGCIRFRDSCYYFAPSTERVNWTEANIACQKLYQHPTDPTKSSNLVSIHNQLEQDFIVAHMGTDRVHRWTGLHEDHWDQTTLFYTDHTYVDYINWNWKEPLPNTRGALCVMMYSEVARAGKWNDELCDVKNSYVCKMKKDPSVTVPQIHDPECPEGFSHLDGVCFSVIEFVNAVGSKSDAQAECLSKGARLASITNIHENSFIHTLFAAKFGYDLTPSRNYTWIGANLLNKQLKWDSGCFPKYVNIPNFYTGGIEWLTDRCVVMEYNGQWRVMDCDSKQLYAVCEKRLQECDIFETPNTGICPPGFTDECNDYCLRISYHTPSIFTEDNMKTWDVARRDCNWWNSSLVTIRNENDQRCIEKHIEKSSGSLWIGLYENSYNIDTGVGNWVWMDEEYSGTYQNWSPGEPSITASALNRETCTEIFAGRMDLGKWNNIVCHIGVKRGYICEKAKIPAANTAVPMTSSSTDYASSSDLTVPPNGVKSPPLPKVSGGAIAGMAIGVLILIPALATVAFVFWKRRFGPTPGRSAPVSFRKNPKEDEKPVVNEDGFESYT